MTTTPERDLDGTVEVVLVGGPSDLPENVRAQRMRSDQYKIKVPHHGGYEHFELPDGDRVVATPLVLRWTTRTRVAE